MTAYKCDIYNFRSIPKGIKHLTLVRRYHQPRVKIDLRKIPKSVKSLNISGCGDSWTESEFPEWVTTLTLKNFRGRQLPKLPPKLRWLSVRKSGIVELTGIPPTLRHLGLRDCYVLGHISELPEVMDYVRISNCSLLFSEIKLPRLRLGHLDITYQHYRRWVRVYPAEMGVCVLRDYTDDIPRSNWSASCTQGDSTQPLRITDYLSIRGAQSPRTKYAYRGSDFIDSMSFENLRFRNVKVWTLPPGLKSLQASECCLIADCPDTLQSLTVENACLPHLPRMNDNLESLTLRNLPKLLSYTGIPDNLKHIEINDVPLPTDFPRLHHLCQVAIDRVVSTTTYMSGAQYLDAPPPEPNPALS